MLTIIETIFLRKTIFSGKIDNKYLVSFFPKILKDRARKTYVMEPIKTYSGTNKILLPVITVVKKIIITMSNEDIQIFTKDNLSKETIFSRLESIYSIRKVAANTDEKPTDAPTKPKGGISNNEKEIFVNNEIALV